MREWYSLVEKAQLFPCDYVFTVLSVAHWLQQQSTRRNTPTQTVHKNQIKVNKYQTILERFFCASLVRCAIFIAPFLIQSQRVQLAASTFFIFFSIRFEFEYKRFYLYFGIAFHSRFLFDSLFCSSLSFSLSLAFVFPIPFVCLFICRCYCISIGSLSIFLPSMNFRLHSTLDVCQRTITQTNTTATTTTTSRPIDTGQQQTRCIAGKNTSAGV